MQGMIQALYILVSAFRAKWLIAVLPECLASHGDATGFVFPLRITDGMHRV